MLKKFAGAAILPLVALAGPAFGQADAVAEFYENETISVVIGYPPGGGFDAATRLLIRYMPKYIPGEPEMIPINMPGAGSLLAANHLFNTAEADGTEFGLIGGSMPFSPLWDDEGIRFDATEFSWIGSTDRWVGIALIRSDSNVQTIEDAMEEEVTVGATGAGDVTSIYPRVLNELIGTRFNIVAGYQGTSDLNLAIEQGEVDGRLGWDWDGVTTTNPEWIEDDFIRPILQMASTSHPDLTDVPLALDLAENEEDRQVMRLVFASQEMARPFVAPPGVPEERLAALRDAFDATMNDPEFLADAERMNIPIKPTSWGEIEELVDSIYSTPQDLIDRAAAMINEQ